MAHGSARVVDLAHSLGFDLCGVAPAADFPDLEHLDDWLERGYAGEMAYLGDDRRRSPLFAMKEARSVIVCALNYNTAFSSSIEALQPGPGDAAPRGWISRYAWGDDYHKVLGKRLEALVALLGKEFPESFAARAYVDTGPIVERVAAKYAGLGWLAKNTCLINEALGSFFFLGVILTTLDLQPATSPSEAPPADQCGNCTLCLEACPTGALVEPYVLDARRCISYLTIELRGAIPLAFRERMGRHIFGCDICQDVCPWNRRAPESALPEFQPRGNAANSMFLPDLEWLVSLGEEEFREVFRNSPVKRAKWRGLLRNVCVAIANTGLRPGEPRYERIRERLTLFSTGPDAVLSEHARWALDRLASRAPH